MIAIVVLLGTIWLSYEVYVSAVPWDFTGHLEQATERALFADPLVDGAVLIEASDDVRCDSGGAIGPYRLWQVSGGGSTEAIAALFGDRAVSQGWTVRTPTSPSEIIVSAEDRHYSWFRRNTLVTAISVSEADGLYQARMSVYPEEFELCPS